MNTTAVQHHRSRFKLIRQIKARPRLAIAIVVGALVAAFMPHDLAQHEITRLIVGWNAGAVLYILMALHMIFWSDHDQIRTRACKQDEGQFVVLGMVVTAAVVSLAAIVAELAVVKDMHGVLRYAHIGLAAFTIVSSWAFTHIMFALHYAHDYYVALTRNHDGGLDFPGETLPDYSDFLYFACIIGTSGQTADVCFKTRHMRRVGLVHCVLAFFFNTTVLALTINIASGLF
ncbi:MAG: DUF1345 domain-containing protein [Burkholderiales bacterium]|nr:DUF1345 domain-containing protein [Burkholderiales bacterium]